MLLLDVIRATVAPIQEQLSSGALFPLGDGPPQRQRLFGDCVLNTMLPRRYRVATGRVFSNDAVLDADQLLIIDADHALPLGLYQALETVYACCDVIDELTPATFYEGLQRVAEFKRLRREKSTAYDVTPVHHLRMFGARYAQLSDDQINPSLGYMFADAAADPQELHNQLYGLLKREQIRPEHTPDAIFGLRDAWVIVRQTRTGELAVPRSTFSKFGLYLLGEHTALWMYMLLNTALSQIQLRGPDLMKALGALGKRG
jgi:hypothetical protein